MIIQKFGKMRDLTKKGEKTAKETGQRVVKANGELITNNDELENFVVKSLNEDDTPDEDGGEKAQPATEEKELEEAIKEHVEADQQATEEICDKILEYEPSGEETDEQLEGGFEEKANKLIESDEPSEAIDQADGEKLDQLEESEKMPEDTEPEDEPVLEVPCLLFKNPVFHTNTTNVTVRKGPKWSQFELKRGDKLNICETGQNLHIGVATIANISGPIFIKSISENTLLKEHDPKCRDIGGLIKVMKEVYDGFNPEKDLVTVIEFSFSFLTE
jgi:hypothetical protein